MSLRKASSTEQCSPTYHRSNCFVEGMPRWLTPHLTVLLIGSVSQSIVWIDPTWCTLMWLQTISSSMGAVWTQWTAVLSKSSSSKCKMGKLWELGANNRRLENNCDCFDYDVKNCDNIENLSIPNNLSFHTFVLLRVVTLSLSTFTAFFTLQIK